MSISTSTEVTGGGPVTTRVLHLYRVRLDRPGLDTALRVVTDRFTRAQTVVRSERDGTQFTSGSLSGLLTQIERSSERGDAEHLDDLQVLCRAPNRSVALVIAKDRATLTVAGRDAAWVHGKAEQFRRLLLRSGASERPVRAGPTVCGVAGVAGAVAVDVVIVAVSGGRPDGSLIAIAVGFAALVGVAGALAGRRRVRQARVHLYVAGPQPRRSLWARMTIAERLFAVSVVVSLVGLVLNAIGS